MSSLLSLLQLSSEHRKRIYEIIQITFQNDLGDFIPANILKKYKPFITIIKKFQKKNHIRSHEELSRCLRISLEKLGPTFIKLGQLLATRSDIFPAYLINELSKLQNQVAPFPNEDAFASIERNLQKPITEIFAHIDDTPIASASIAQVYYATLHTNDTVAIKIQRPHITKLITIDLEILEYIIPIIINHQPQLMSYSLPLIFNEFKRQLFTELNFTNEYSNLLRFAQVYQNHPYITVPTVYNEYCTPELLVMSFVHGITLTEAIQNNIFTNTQKKHIANTLAESSISQTIKYKIFHADPHPGNIIITNINEDKPHIIFIDFGIIGFIPNTYTRALNKMFLGLLNQNNSMIIDGIHTILDFNANNNQDVIWMETEFISRYSSLPLQNINIQSFFTDINAIIQHFGFVVPAPFIMISKHFITIEGVCLSLYKNFNPFFILQEYFSNNQQHFSYNTVKENIKEQSIRYYELINELPQYMTSILQTLQNNDVQLKMNIVDLPSLNSTIEHMGNRFIFGIVLGSTLISSALMVHANIPPFFQGISIIGMLGFGIAGLMSIGFLISMIHHSHNNYKNK